MKLFINRVHVVLDGVKCVVDFYPWDKSIMFCKHGSIEGKGSFSVFCKNLRAKKIPHKKDCLIQVNVPKSFFKK